jgi:ABC-2 type transport system ATP-binding protein
MRAMFDLRGRIWRRNVSRDELPALERALPVVSTKLMAGRTIAHVYAEASPGAGFEVVEPDLKDVYFSVMAGHYRRPATAPQSQQPPKPPLPREKEAVS